MESGVETRQNGGSEGDGGGSFRKWVSERAKKEVMLDGEKRRRGVVNYKSRPRLFKCPV